MRVEILDDLWKRVRQVKEIRGWRLQQWKEKWNNYNILNGEESKEEEIMVEGCVKQEDTGRGENEGGKQETNIASWMKGETGTKDKKEGTMEE